MELFICREFAERLTCFWEDQKWHVSCCLEGVYCSHFRDQGLESQMDLNTNGRASKLNSAGPPFSSHLSSLGGKCISYVLFIWNRDVKSDLLKKESCWKCLIHMSGHEDTVCSQSRTGNVGAGQGSKKEREKKAQYSDKKSTNDNQVLLPGSRCSSCLAIITCVHHPIKCSEQNAKWDFSVTEVVMVWICLT